jgi:putative glutamine amidotransferase
MSARAPLVGITAEVEWHEGNPSRPIYSADTKNFEALRGTGVMMVVLPHEPDLAESYLDVLDGLFIPGGGYQFPHPDLFPAELSADIPAHKYRRTQFERAMIRGALARRIPLLGVCGGFQTLNAVLGGKLIVSLADDWHTAIQHRQPEPYTEGTHTVQPVPGTRLAGLTGTKPYSVNSKHRQGVVEAARGARVSARAPDGMVEAIEVDGHPFCIGVQWHPEFFITPADRRLFEGFAATCHAHAVERQRGGGGPQ